MRFLKKLFRKLFKKGKSIQSYFPSRLRWERWRKWRKANPSVLWPSASELHSLKELMEQPGWQVFKKLIQHRIEYQNAKLCELTDFHQTNFLRGSLDEALNLYDLVETEMENLDRYERRQAELAAAAAIRPVGNAQYWGSPNFHNEWQR